MDDQARLRVKGVSHRALESPPGERVTVITEECGGDDDVRGKVEALLRAFAEAGTDGGDGPLVKLAVKGEGPGAVIDRYKLLQEIGEGGFVTVHVAEQTEPVSRKVTLEVIKPGMDTKQVIARYETANSLAALLAMLLLGAGDLVAKKPSDPPPKPPQAADPAIAYSTGGELFGMSADGTNVTRALDGDDAFIGVPDWSPVPVPGIDDGEDRCWIACTDETSAGMDGLFLVDTDGTDPVQPTDTPTRYEVGATWSPDDSEIAFLGARARGGSLGNHASEIMSAADGSDRRAILEANARPVWRRNLE